MKLYVVDRDDSACDMIDYRILGIFSTKEKAADFIKKAKQSDNVNENYYYDYDITETYLDSPGEEMFNLSAYMVD